MGATIIAFPTTDRRRTYAAIDWSALERVRRTVYRRVPRVALQILRRVLEADPGSATLASGRWWIRAGLPGGGEPVPVSPRGLTGTSQALDLLERFARHGAHLLWGNLECRLEAGSGTDKMVWLQHIPRSTAAALRPMLRAAADQRLVSSRWAVTAAPVNDLDLLLILIENEGRDYLGLFDRWSAHQLMCRLRAGYSVHLRATAMVALQTE